MANLPAKALIEISKTEGIVQPRTENDWYWYSDGSEGGAIPFNINFLYRGQNKRFLPMRPSIARGLRSETDYVCEMPLDDQALVVLRKSQSLWFASELDHHPITRHAQEQKVKLDRIALAQHYGVPTQHLDLTDNFDVAAFFATCQYDRSGWRPMERGTGIVYRLALGDLKSPFDHVRPLGPQPLPRPSEQKAWIAETSLHRAFDGGSTFLSLEFEHDRAVAEYFLEMFNGGETLFPPDPLARVADEICNCNQIPAELVERALERLSKLEEFSLRPEQIAAIRTRISKMSELTSYRTLLHPELVQPFLDDFEWRKLRLSDIKARVRLVRSERRS